MDPENVAMRTRLAEVYVRLNKKQKPGNFSLPQPTACERAANWVPPKKS